MQKVAEKMKHLLEALYFKSKCQQNTHSYRERETRSGKY